MSTIVNTSLRNIITNKYDIILLFDVVCGNPNGDPDAANQPRQLHDGSGIGIVTDVCLKRKIRDMVMKLVQRGELPEKEYDIYIQRGMTLDARDLESVKEVGIADTDATADDTTEVKQNLKALAGTSKDKELHDAMCKRYFDVRTFGNVPTLLSGTIHSRNVKGPVQFGIAKSVDPIHPEDISVFRCAVTKEEKADSHTTFGSKYIVPYGLYMCKIHVSADEAEKTGFSEGDMQTLVKAMTDMFDDDYSSVRGEMNVRKLVVFKHESKHGNAHMSQLENLVDVHLRDGVVTPSSFRDYVVDVKADEAPEGVTVTEVV